MITRGNGHRASETSKQVVRRWFEAMEHHALDEAGARWAPDAFNHASGRSSFRPARGLEALQPVHQALRLSFPHRRWAIGGIFAQAARGVWPVTVRLSSGV